MLIDVKGGAPFRQGAQKFELVRSNLIPSSNKIWGDLNQYILRGTVFHGPKMLFNPFSKDFLQIPQGREGARILRTHDLRLNDELKRLKRSLLKTDMEEGLHPFKGTQFSRMDFSIQKKDMTQVLVIETR